MSLGLLFSSCLLGWPTLTPQGHIFLCLQIKLSCNTGLSVTSNFCCSETELRNHKLLDRREWQFTPVILPGKFHRQRNLEGYSPWGQKRVERDQVRMHTHLFLLFLFWTSRKLCRFHKPFIPSINLVLKFPRFSMNKNYCIMLYIQKYVYSILWIISGIFKGNLDYVIFTLHAELRI